MNKEKYKKGAMITSLDQLMKSEFIWSDEGENNHRIINRGWFQNWSILTAKRRLGKIYHAYR